MVIGSVYNADVGALVYYSMLQKLSRFHEGIISLNALVYQYVHSAGGNVLLLNLLQRYEKSFLIYKNIALIC